MSYNVDGQQLLLGGGELYFAEIVNGVMGGEMPLGNITTFEITPSVSEITKKSSATAARPVIASDVTDFKLGVRMVGDQFNKQNLALAFGGQIGSLVNGSGTVVDEVLNDVEQGKYYPLTKRNVSAVTVTGSAGSPTYAAGTDYEVDTVAGRIYIVVGGTITDGTDLKVDFTYSAETKVTIKAGLKAQVLGFLRFVSKNTRGPNRELQAWRVRLSSNGAVPFISDQYAEFTLEGQIEADLSAHPTEPYFRLIEL